MEEGPKIVTKAYDVTSWLLQQVNTFPRAYRFVLGDRIASTALDILEGLVEASHRRDKRAVLDTVKLKLERLRYLIRMSKDLQLLRYATHAATYGLWYRVFHAIAFRRTPVPSASSAGEGQAVPGCPVRRRVEQ